MTRCMPFAVLMAAAALMLPFGSIHAQNFSRVKSNFQSVRGQGNGGKTFQNIRGGGTTAKFRPGAFQQPTTKPNFKVRPGVVGNQNGFKPNFKPQVVTPNFGKRPNGFPNNKIPGRVPGNLGKIPGNGGKIPGRLPGNLGKLPGNLGGRLPGKLPGNLGKLPGNLGGKVSGKLPGNLGKLPGNLGGKFPGGKLPGNLGGKLPNVKPGIGGLNGIKPQIGPLAGIAQLQNLNLGAKKPIPFKPLLLNKLPGKLGGIKQAQLLKLKAPQALAAKNFAIQKLSLHPGCHWWVDFCIGWHWQTNHCHWWDYCYTPGYWQCWTPCYYNVVYCPPAPGFVSSTWYFGVDCMLIPDMACYGVQKVQPHSPAALAGLLPGDMIVSINGYSIADEGILQRSIQTSGGILQLGVVRDGASEPVLVNVALRRVQTLSY